MRVVSIFFIPILILSTTSLLSQSKSLFRVNGSTVTSRYVRFQFLSHSLVRLEFSSKNNFINAPTAVVLKRNWKEIKIKADESNGWLNVQTGKLTLKYLLGSGKFAKNNLVITWNNPDGKFSWSPEDSDKKNLGGISLSLDRVREGHFPKFTPGILSKSGYFVLDDSKSPVWDKRNNWIEQRKDPANQDWYFFVYGRDYAHVLKEYSELCGKIPMIQRYILGSWITDLNFPYYPNSDFLKEHPYSYKNIEDEIMRFRDNGIPLDIMVLDYAWHNYGWDGTYDWSSIFPHPKQFLNWAHEHGIKVTVNDHPGYGRESVYSDEDSKAALIRKKLNMPIPPPPKLNIDIEKDWKFGLDPKNIGISEEWYLPKFDDSDWKPIQAGLRWESQGYPKYDGIAWYRKSVFIPAKPKIDSLYLVFGGVDDEYDLFVNGKKAAHYGDPTRDYTSVANAMTYTNILSFVKRGADNLIAVKVNDWGGEGGIKKAPVIIADQIPPHGMRFNLAEKNQAEAFMEVLHDPLIDKGVNFWWIDGGTGSCEMQGLNSQMWTNRVYYDYTQQHTKKRAFVFSRYGEWGNHRYPGVFTGDTHSQWLVLSYEIPYTARGGNVLTPYITHDIGGFIGRKIDFDLYARWIEFGVFSPVLRLHSVHENPAEGNLRMPWTYGEKGMKLVKKFFQLRYKLIPYIYTYCRIAYDDALPIVRPLYLEYPNLDNAYLYPNEYFFGKELLVAPIVDSENVANIYLPPGKWYDYFTDEEFDGGEVIHKNYNVDEIPVFVKEGSIIPTGPVRDFVDERPLDTLLIDIYCSQEGKFNLYDDDGTSLNYLQNSFSWTPISYIKHSGGESEVNIGPTKGEFKGQVYSRAYEIRIHQISEPKTIVLNKIVLSQNKQNENSWEWDSKNSLATIKLKPVKIREDVNILLK